MHQGFLMGFHDKKIEVIDSITNITEKAKTDVLSGIKHKKGVPYLVATQLRELWKPD